MKTEAYLYLEIGDIQKAAVQHRYVLKLREAIGMCSAPPAAAHYLLEKYGKSLGVGRELWPEVGEELGRRIKGRIDITK